MAAASELPIATEPWLAIRAACRPASASRTAVASSGVPNVAYGATRTAPPSTSCW